MSLDLDRFNLELRYHSYVLQSVGEGHPFTELSQTDLDTLELDRLSSLIDHLHESLSFLRVSSLKESGVEPGLNPAPV